LSGVSMAFVIKRSPGVSMVSMEWRGWRGIVRSVTGKCDGDGGVKVGSVKRGRIECQPVWFVCGKEKTHRIVREKYRVQTKANSSGLSAELDSRKSLDRWVRNIGRIQSTRRVGAERSSTGPSANSLH
jgi:hypothetical protein